MSRFRDEMKGEKVINGINVIFGKYLLWKQLDRSNECFFKKKNVMNVFEKRDRGP